MKRLSASEHARARACDAGSAAEPTVTIAHHRALEHKVGRVSDGDDGDTIRAGARHVRADASGRERNIGCTLEVTLASECGANMRGCW